MSEKRFLYGIINGSRQAHIKDCHTCKSATIDVYDDDFKYFVDLLNTQQATIDKLDQENADLLGARIKAQEEWEKCTDKLKAKILEQQATIQELERKLKKYAKIGEEQLKQIIDLQDELNECRARPTLATDERGVVKVEYR